MAAVFVAASSARAGKGERAARPTCDDMKLAIATMIASPERLELPLERIRGARDALCRQRRHHLLGSTGRMTPFIQRLLNAEDDGLNPSDYPSTR
jgi:hypothetical protein